jgi:hypothetical protein
MKLDVRTFLGRQLSGFVKINGKAIPVHSEGAWESGGGNNNNNNNNNEVK